MATGGESVPPMPDESLGLMSLCHRCGGDNTLTGHERLRRPERGFGRRNGSGYRIKEAEYVCTSCGAKVWSPTGTVDEPSDAA